MFKDKDEELKRLEAELLFEEELEEAKALLDDPDDFGEETSETYYNFSNQYGGVKAYNADTTDEDIEQYSDEVYSGKAHSDIRSLCILALCLIAGIFGVLIWWAVRFVGL